MLNIICNLIAKIVFLGINGTICIPILIALFPEFVGQVKDIAYVSNKTFKMGESNVKSRKMGLH
ncbi:hypothetical protein CIW83_09285 [Tissierella sp. P1]|uniref:hypothetical protein n=1 Tax=Tissierella sp. P1 TaxID=1280483 RepID=UPI000BA016B2|nr:hypothetical protein [Tissierella sp. P1]OZV12282.1 hypothetical protein CIW83_09285 [Tissierella sp. P1]